MEIDQEFTKIIITYRYQDPSRNIDRGAHAVVKSISFDGQSWRASWEDDEDERFRSRRPNCEGTGRTLEEALKNLSMVMSLTPQEQRRLP